MSAMALEARIANLEGTVEQIGQRLNSFDARFNNVDHKIDVFEERLGNRIDSLDERLTNRIDRLDERLGGRIEQLDRRFTWMMGLLVVAMLLPVIERFVLR
jgi:chromosome segregation ATPase